VIDDFHATQAAHKSSKDCPLPEEAPSSSTIVSADQIPAERTLYKRNLSEVTENPDTNNSDASDTVCHAQQCKKGV